MLKAIAGGAIGTLVALVVVAQVRKHTVVGQKLFG
jgi:hypothetical protein